MSSRKTAQSLVLFSILFAGSTIAFAGGFLAPAPAEIEIHQGPQPESMFEYETHLLTVAELEQLKAEIGIRDMQKNYNMIIDGFGTGLAPPTEAEWEAMIGTSWADGVNDPMLEPAIDHSQEPYFPRVRSQGSQGSCAAWSVAYYINGYNQAKDNNWTDASTGNNDHLMSPAFVYNKANSGFDSGSWPSDNMEVIKTVGNSIWTEMPYNQNDPVGWGDEDAWRSAPEYRGLDYTSTSPVNTDVLKAWVAEGYALSIVLDAGNYGRGLGSGDDIINATEHIPGTPNHANTIVGYNDSKADGSEIGAFKIVNSWGAGWGSAWGGNGYYWMTYEAAKELPGIVLKFRDMIDYEPSLLGVIDLNPQGGRDAPVTLGIGPTHDPAATRSPWWRGGDHDFPAFMALDYTDFRNEWRSGHNQFFLTIGAGTGSSTITSFKMELYESGYVPASYTRISDESPDTPEITPGTVTVTLIPGIRILNPLDNENINGLVNISGKATNTMWTVVLREDFEGAWPGGWTVGDSTPGAGEDYWGAVSTRSYSGTSSAWSAQFGEHHEVAYSQDFDTAGILPGGWTLISNGPDSHPWEMVLESGSDFIAECDSSAAGPGTDISEWLQMTTGFDATSYDSLNLTFYLDYAYKDGDEYASVLYSTSPDYPAFTGLQTWPSTVQGSQDVDLSAALGDPEVYLAFLYHATDDLYMRVDDVQVIGGQLNENRQLYDNEMDAYMEHDVDLSMYTEATLVYNYWLDSEISSDQLYVSYYDGTWNYIDPHSGDSGGWQGSSVQIPVTATKIGFQFHSDGGTVGEGAYVDDVVLLGHGAIDNVLVKVDDSSWQLASGTGNWYYEWDTSSLDEGWHTIYARGYFGVTYTEDQVRVTVDYTLPENPNSYTSSHTPTVWSDDDTVWISWSGAWDNVSGIGGFAVEWTMSPVTVPSETMDTTESETTSYPLPDANDWYVHIRTVDKGGNWAVGAYHVGPFYIDTTPPGNPNSFSGSHQVGVWSADDTIFIEWFGAVDTLSGVHGYSYSWSQVPDTLPINFVTTLNNNATSFMLSPSNSWYFHVRTQDVAGNWAPDAYHVGPFYIDVENPWTSHSIAGTSGDFGWYISPVIVTLSMQDNHSGIDSTYYSTDGAPFSIYASPLNILADGNHTVEYYSVDNVGNTEATRTSSAALDATAPLNPDGYTSSHTVSSWSADDTIDISWTGAWDATSGVYAFSCEWTQSSGTLPDTTHETTSPSTTSPSLATGDNWYFHVRTRDVAGNWAIDAYHVGPFFIDATPPVALDNVWANLEGPGWQNVNITWTPANDNESGVLRYDIFYGTIYDAGGSGYMLLSSVPADTYFFVHIGGGEGNFSNYFYQIRAVDFADNSAPFTTQAGKFTKNLASGWKLLSVPLEQLDGSPAAVLRTLDYSVARYYYAGTWTSYYPHKTYCTLDQITTGMGIWVDVASGSYLTVAGRVPTTTEIYLARGWNLIGFPSFDAGYTIADLKADSGATNVETFDGTAPPHYLRDAVDAEPMLAGSGYWVEVSSSGTWTVSNDVWDPHVPRGVPGSEDMKSTPTEGLDGAPPRGLGAECPECSLSLPLMMFTALIGLVAVSGLRRSYSK